jgi:hypothetical protein
MNKQLVQLQLLVYFSTYTFRPLCCTVVRPITLNAATVISVFYFASFAHLLCLFSLIFVFNISNNI